MGYSELDLKLMDAWFEVQDAVMADPGGEVSAAVCRRVLGKTLDRPLRSWSLVLRASDRRIPDDNAQGVVGMTAARMRQWCDRVRIDRPGVSLDEAASLFGVNRTTVSRWATPAGHRSWKAKLDADESAEAAAAEHDVMLARCRERFGTPTQRVVHGKLLDLSYTINRSNRRRDEVRVWTRGLYGVDPGGEVWPGYWEGVRGRLVEQVPPEFVQTLTRVDRRLSAKTRVWQWVCPVEAGGCGGLVYKVYLPMPMWTLVRALGGGRDGCGASRVAGDAERPVGGGEVAHGDAPRGARTGRCASLATPDEAARGFVCLKCAGLLYESSERTSVPGRTRDGARRAVDTWDRFVKRISGGVLTGAMVGRVDGVDG